MGRLNKAGFCLGLALCLLWAPPGWSVTEACRESQVQPENIDLDQPRDQLARQSDLIIPPGATIGEVQVHNRPIFDTDKPGQDNALYRLLNWLNVPTWDSALASQLVFSEGDYYSQDDLSESERILRSRRYLTAAWVSPIRVCGDQVDVSVLARDTWTLFPSLGVSRSGGENTATVGVSDPNFLGSGKSLSISRTRDADRSTTSFVAHDPNLLGSRWEARLGYADRSDGRGRNLSIERPFYSEQALWSFGIQAAEDRREDALFFGGDKVSHFERDSSSASISYGTALSRSGMTQPRLLAGYRYEEQRFSPVEGRVAPDPFPDDRVLSYPWIGFQWRQNRFHETVNLTQLQRVEDVRDGIDFRTEFGYSAEGLGASEDRIVVQHHFSDSIVATRRSFADYRFSQSGHYRLDEDRVENLTATLQGRFFYGGVDRWSSWYSVLEFSAARNLTADQQMTLGGDNGLRGYPRHYQQGNRRFLGTLERRYFPDWHPFSLFRIGGVAFLDVGRAWFDDGRRNGPDEGVLTDLGVGLRLASSRIEVDRMLHLDFAVPLDGDDRIDGFQVLLRGRTRF
ncbi:surface antigen-like protein [Halospina denitrificans]|uniref:Surface antigen-like protein n=1 Tax=Halospina denitrificans TaxID=332522 RepID=A0A4R7JGX6_9GAMM|nr:BamA/TamA family outer membrane protein [Halospina denitrificans]TDT37050.1 surface antigen-like protein [Halospina denitrificans]